MSSTPLSPSDVISIVSAAINAGALLTGIIVLFFTWKSVETLTRQIRSQSKHTVVEAHKSLFMDIIKDEKLLEIVAGASADRFRRNILTSMLINHCARIFKDFEEGLRPKEDLDNFIADARDLFSIESVRERWPSVRMLHDGRFRAFVDDNVMPTFKSADSAGDYAGAPALKVVANAGAPAAAPSGIAP